MQLSSMKIMFGMLSERNGMMIRRLSTPRRRERFRVTQELRLRGWRL
jgi:hypothetical protein